MALVTKYCPDCKNCPAQVEQTVEKCPDCGKENLQSVYELACAVEKQAKFIESITTRLNTIACQYHDYKIEKIAIEMRKFNSER